MVKVSIEKQLTLEEFLVLPEGDVNYSSRFGINSQANI